VSGYIDITEPVLARSNISVVREKFRQKARAYKLVREADLRINSVRGTRRAESCIDLETTGEVSLSLMAMPTVTLRFAGSGEYRQDERRVYLKSFRVLDDIAGVANILIESVGIRVGRSLHVTDRDHALLQSLIPG